MDVGEDVTANGYINARHVRVIKHDSKRATVPSVTVSGLETCPLSDPVRHEDSRNSGISAGREGFQPKKPVNEEAAIAGRVPSAVGENSKTPVKRLATDTDKSEVVRKNNIGVHHADIEETCVFFNSAEIAKVKAV